MTSKDFGDRGERMAAAYLESIGMQLVAQKVSRRGGEIDLVAMDGEVVVLCEVKARSRPGVRPAQAINRTKIRALSKAALSYVSERGWLDKEIRFDVVEVFDTFDSASVRHIKNAFYFDSSVMTHF